MEKCEYGSAACLMTDCNSGNDRLYTIAGLGVSICLDGFCPEGLIILFAFFILFIRNI